MDDATRAQHLAQVAKVLAEHGSLPYLGRTHIASFLLGSFADARNTLQAWGIDPDREEISFINDENAEILLDPSFSGLPPLPKKIPTVPAAPLSIYDSA
jgi:hypothetical protein